MLLYWTDVSSILEEKIDVSGLKLSDVRKKSLKNGREKERMRKKYLLNICFHVLQLLSINSWMTCGASIKFLEDFLSEESKKKEKSTKCTSFSRYPILRNAENSPHR